MFEAFNRIFMFVVVLQSLFENLMKCHARDDVKAIVVTGDQGVCLLTTGVFGVSEHHRVNVCREVLCWV